MTVDDPADARTRHAQSLQARITAAILLTAITVLFVGCTLFMLEQRHSERLGVRAGDQHLADVLALNVAEPLAAGEDAQVRHNMQILAYFPRVLGGEVRDGARVVTFRRAGVATPPGVETLHAPLRGRGRGRAAGEVVLTVLPFAGLTTASHYLAMGGALFFAATALALFLGRWLAARITTPMARLSRAMEAVGASGTFQVRVEPNAADELGRLTACFNKLMARLQLKDQALRRTLDELVEARDASEAANLAKSRFLANMSHEIRTPLNGVLAMAQILARSPLEPGQREQVDVIHQSGETLLSLLNDILDVSKIEAGKLELEVADFDVEAVVQAAAAGFAGVAKRKGLALVVETGPQAHGLRRGDMARLRQILNNFLSNALKFTEAGEVRLSVAGPGPEDPDGLTFTVRDTGMGISSDNQPLLFQKFTQLDASTTRRFGGTGLGLAICRELSELMGGRVWVESLAGEGSSFSVYLPLERSAAGALGVGTAPASPFEAAPEAWGGPVEPARGPFGPEPATPLAFEPEALELGPLKAETGEPERREPEAGEPEAGEPEAGERELGEPEPAAASETPTARAALRVLAAEDNATNQLVLSTVMQIFGVDLTLAADGLEAVDAWRAGVFDVVLMDIQMPHLDGVAATRRIRAEEAAAGRARTPILALSANALTHQVESYLAAGMDGHVAKPIELAKLQAALESVFNPAEPAAAAA